MTNSVQSWTAMTAATIPVPASKTGICRAERHLVGIGLFNARCERTRWRFTHYAHAIPAGHREATLLRGTAGRLPTNGVLIGWNVDQSLMPALLNAAATAPPIVAQSFLARLFELLNGGVVDLALGHGTLPLSVIANDQAIYSPASDADANIDDWASGQVGRLQRDLADEALAIWRLYVRSADFTGIDAEGATDAWVERCKKLRIVASANRAP